MKIFKETGDPRADGDIAAEPGDKKEEETWTKEDERKYRKIAREQDEESTPDLEGESDSEGDSDDGEDSEDSEEEGDSKGSDFAGLIAQITHDETVRDNGHVDPLAFGVADLKASGPVLGGENSEAAIVRVGSRTDLPRGGFC